MVQRRISIDEVIEANKNGSLTEIFGTGTAAVISPVGEMMYKDEVHSINGGMIGELSKKIFSTLQGIQYGEIEDPFKWVVRIG